MNKLELYENLTNVDLHKQKQIWDERGKGYYGEFLLFSELLPNIDGDCKFLMNIEIPIANKKTEIDLLMIHETGVFVFEIKHYKSKIYGDSESKVWTQFFKTEPNRTFKNPISQNQYHIRALRDFLGDIPFYSFIVFTHEEVELNVKVTSQDEVCILNDVLRKINNTITSNPPIFNTEKIEYIFEKLKVFSPMKETLIENNAEIPLFSFVESTRKYLLNQKSELSQKTLEFSNKKANYKPSMILKLLSCKGTTYNLKKS